MAEVCNLLVHRSYYYYYNYYHQTDWVTDRESEKYQWRKAASDLDDHHWPGCGGSSIQRQTATVDKKRSRSARTRYRSSIHKSTYMQDIFSRYHLAQKMKHFHETHANVAELIVTESKTNSWLSYNTKQNMHAQNRPKKNYSSNYYQQIRRL